jgi:SHS2 domain-containing protein
VRRLRFRTFAHGADLRVALWGADEEELVGNAVAAAVTLALGRLPRLPARDRVPILPWPADLPSRLVRAVNEALFHLYAKGLVAVEFELSPRGATLGLAQLPPGRAPELEVKAATYHDLRPHWRARRLAAMLTLDV